jgi:UDP-glucose 4-epimerase
VYGVSERQPIPEDQPLRPISLYGATKASCEAMLSAFGPLFSMQVWVFRFANIVGGKVRKRGRTVISDFLHRLREDPTRLEILGNGRQAKSYLYNSDCIEAMLFCVERAQGPFEVFNLSGDDQLPVTEIAEMVTAAMGLRGVEFSYTGGEGGWLGDVPRFRLDPSKLNALGWRARYTSREAVAKTIAELLEA